MSAVLYASRRAPVVPLPTMTLVEKRTFGPGARTVTLRYRIADTDRHVTVTLFRGLADAWTKGAVVAPSGPEFTYNQRRALMDRARADLRRAEVRPAGESLAS